MNHSRNTYRGLIFYATVLLILFYGIGYRGLWGPEGRWAEIVREMFLTGDFFHPAINWQPYFDKPLFTYWAIALVKVIGGGLDEWAVRIPSAVSGLITLWCTVYIGRQLWSKGVGITAGWILLTTYGFLFWSRTGAADMENLAAITLAVAWYVRRRGKTDFYSYLVFYLICFIGAQFKGLTALVVPLLVIFPDIMMDKDWKRHLCPSNLFAFMAGLFVYLLPFVYAGLTANGYSENGLAMVFQENIQRFFRPFDHREPVYVYLYYLPVLFLPWTPLLLFAIPFMARFYKRLDMNGRWLLIATAFIFLFFTLSGSRRSYYILPIFPFCALVAAFFLDRVDIDGWKRAAITLQRGLILLACILELASPVLMPLITEKIGFVPPRGLMTSMVVLGATATVALATGGFSLGLLPLPHAIRRQVTGLVLATAILSGGYFCIQQNMLDTFRTERPFLLGLKAEAAQLGPGHVALYRKNIADVAFYLDLDGPIRVLTTKSQVLSFLEGVPGRKILVARGKDLERLKAFLPEGWREPTVSARIVPWSHKRKARLVAWMIGGDAGR